MTPKTMRLLFTLALTLFLTTGCNLVYKQNIQQGNAIEQEDLDKLRIGMTRNQVAFLLGTPAIRDPFHQDRWDYVSTFSRRGEDAVMRKVTLYFENGVLGEMIGVEGDEFIFEEEEEEEPSDSDADAGETGNLPEADESTPAEVMPLAVPAAEEAPFQDAAPEPTTTATAGGEPSAVNGLPESAQPVSERIDGPKSAVPAETLESVPAEVDGWAIQLGAFDSDGNARNLSDRLEAAGIETTITEQPATDDDVRYLVRKYGIETRSEAERLLEEIASGLGVNGFLVPPGD